jgi:hypothetical protein
VLIARGVYRLAEAIVSCCRALVLLATSCNLRRAELIGVRHHSLDVGNRSVRVLETVYGSASS